MSAPTFELADIIRAQGKRFLEKYGSRIDSQQRKALRAIRNCRTAALGRHLDVCPKCGYEAEFFNSCRNRNCPKCQAGLRRRWIAAREREVLGVPYFHVVFTVPHQLNQLALQNQRLFYNLLFRASAATLQEVAANPKHLGAKISVLCTLHTWGQTLQEHPHVHCVVPQGGIALDHKRWIHPRYRFFLPKNVLKRVFRGKFVDGLRRLYQKKELTLAGSLAHLNDPKQFAEFIRKLHRHHWVVDVRPAFGGPEQVIRYLGRYTHRVAISNHRLLSFDGEKVTFLWKDYTHDGKYREMTIDATEFLRRSVLHVLPKGFVRIRCFGFLANRFRAQRLALCRELLFVDVPETEQRNSPPLPEPSAWLCPHCGTTMVIVRIFIPGHWCSRGSFIENWKYYKYDDPGRPTDMLIACLCTRLSRKSKICLERI
jgi:ssDNA-binding Zn-finger/Zn-ribbon topoisomerase 1